jgi:hypothetical protein
MDANQANFQKRLIEIDRKHSRSRGRFVRLEERDGMLVPVDKVRVTRRVPLRGLMLALVAFLGFKAFLFAYLGPITYADRLSSLEQGNVVEQMGAWAMRPDAVSRWVAGGLPDF